MKKKAFRIYKDWQQAWHYSKSDDKLVYELQKKQMKIKLTDFPTGIVTISDFPFEYNKKNIQRVIGQEIIYYENHIAIGKLFQKDPNIDQVKIYIDILNILKELFQNGIYYGDIHGGNFVCDKTGKSVKLIDFEDHWIKIDNMDSNDLKKTYETLKRLILILNNYNKNDISSSILKTNTFEELDECLNNIYMKTKH